MKIAAVACVILALLSRRAIGRIDRILYSPRVEHANVPLLEITRFVLNLIVIAFLAVATALFFF